MFCGGGGYFIGTSQEIAECLLLAVMISFLAITDGSCVILHGVFTAVPIDDSILQYNTHSILAC